MPFNHHKEDLCLASFTLRCENRQTGPIPFLLTPTIQPSNEETHERKTARDNFCFFSIGMPTQVAMSSFSKRQRWQRAVQLLRNMQCDATVQANVARRSTVESHIVFDFVGPVVVS